MKYEGTRVSGAGKPIYMVSVGKEEMEIMLKILTKANEYTPDITELSIYKRRLTTMVKSLGRVWVEQVKGRTLSTSQSARRIHASVIKNLK